jgi:hypothetical protein
LELDVVAHVYNPSILEAKAEASKVQIQSGLHIKTLSKKQKSKQNQATSGSDL